MTNERYKEVLERLNSIKHRREDLKWIRNSAIREVDIIRIISDCAADQIRYPESMQKEELDYVLGMEFIAAFNNAMVDLKTQREAEAQ